VGKRASSHGVGSFRALPSSKNGKRGNSLNRSEPSSEREVPIRPQHVSFAGKGRKKTAGLKKKTAENGKGSFKEGGANRGELKQKTKWNSIFFQEKESRGVELTGERTARQKI